ncbi:hypothetical protein BGP_2783 [Beggiatoa sp. PS]|nr:hypothetical protein BGP_2783 [Beggiatoa sp. PS]
MPSRSAYRFSVSSMLSFIRTFQEKTRLTDEEGMSILGMKNIHHYARYRNFLLSGNFLAQKKQSYAKTEGLTRLWKALKKGDPLLVRELLYDVPSFVDFMAIMKKGHPLTTKEAIAVVNPAAYVTYCTLAEVSCVGLHIEEEGIYMTSFDPELSKFSDLAVSSYKKLARREKNILTGLWLETLAKKHGIHPIIARERLNQAQKAGLLEYNTEGSKPEIPIEKHTMHYLTVDNGMPAVRKTKLYRGDFLTPNKSSVTIRFEN